MTKQFKIIVEKHPDGYVAYPLGLKGVVVGEGETYEEALADVKSAIAFHIETFGTEAYEDDHPKAHDVRYDLEACITTIMHMPNLYGLLFLDVTAL